MKTLCAFLIGLSFLSATSANANIGLDAGRVQSDIQSGARGVAQPPIGMPQFQDCSRPDASTHHPRCAPIVIIDSDGKKGLKIVPQRQSPHPPINRKR